jgi:hypothetical protein
VEGRVLAGWACWGVSWAHVGFGLLGCLGFWAGFGLSSFFLFSTSISYFKLTQTTQLFEFKNKFEFNPSTQTIKAMHQHECINKVKPKKKFNYL